MSQVRAKFQVNSVTQSENGSSQVSMSPVISASDENKAFWDATPSGAIELSITNPDAIFEEGAEYYVDFTKAEVNSETTDNVAAE